MAKPTNPTMRVDPTFKKLAEQFAREKSLRDGKNITASRVTLAMIRIKDLRKIIMDGKFK